jgi:hypothetical protein
LYINYNLIKERKMKKLVIILCTVAIMVALASSCKSGERCAAYGETYRYQKQSNY